MRIALPIVFLLLLSAIIVFSHEPVPMMDDAPDLSLAVYSACTADSDCGLLARPCDSIAAVRKDRLKELNYYYGTKRHSRACHGDTPARAAQKAVCTEQRCTVTVPAAEEDPR